jgi:glucose-6-phosphate isomerase, archaeal
MTYQNPYTHLINLSTGEIPTARIVLERRLSDLQGLFADSSAETEMLAQNPLIYQVFETEENPAIDGQMRFSTTVIQPGKVGLEYFFTKGHFHGKADRSELYYGLIGEGMLLLQTPKGKIDAQPMQPGAASFVPPHWGHRTINTGSTPFVFLAVYPADAGYNYGAISERGFSSLVIERDGKPFLEPNPKWA